MSCCEHCPLRTPEDAEDETIRASMAVLRGQRIVNVSVRPIKRVVNVSVIRPITDADALGRQSMRPLRGF